MKLHHLSHSKAMSPVHFKAMSPTKSYEYFFPGATLFNLVLENEVRYAGSNADVQPCELQGERGFIVRTTESPLTRTQIEEIKELSRQYEERQLRYNPAIRERQRSSTNFPNSGQSELGTTNPIPGSSHIPAITEVLAVQFQPTYPLHPSNPALDNASSGLATHTRSLKEGPPFLRIDEGAHLELKNKKALPYVLIENLGHGASASVEKVRDVNTGAIYARKVFRNVCSRNLEEAKRCFHRELQIMRRLASHHHIARVHATYIAQRELALILSPVADGGDLAAFLQEYRDLDVDSQGSELFSKSSILQRAFGCLATGLAFMHQQTIRHKDIKPQNILIHRGSVLYTDFGISFDFAQEGSTTTGHPQSFTKRYCAPEIAGWGSRNSTSDIFSLGCVYMEILAALHPPSVPEKLLDIPFYQNLKLIQAFHWYSSNEPYTILIENVAPEITAADFKVFLIAHGARLLSCTLATSEPKPAVSMEVVFESKRSADAVIGDLAKLPGLLPAIGYQANNALPSSSSQRFTPLHVSDPKIELYLPHIIRRMMKADRTERPSASNVVDFLLHQDWFCQDCFDAELDAHHKTDQSSNIDIHNALLDQNIVTLDMLNRLRNESVGRSGVTVTDSVKSPMNPWIRVANQLG